MMAKLNKMSESPAPNFDSELYEASPPPSRSRRDTNVTQASMSPSPAASVSSDKENSSSRTINDTGKIRASMGPPRVPSPGSGNGGKRKRGADKNGFLEPNHRRPAPRVDSERAEIDDYDPDQDMDERRRLRKGLRDLSKNMIENRAEFLHPSSTGLRDTLLKANDYSNLVKQTADATIDSRLLVNAADLSYKKTVALTSGDSALEVDVDEFVSKCMSYMRRANGAVSDGPQAASSTQRRRRRANDDEDGDGVGDDGDMLNWAHLGRFACMPNNSRPAVPGFLLGPLSLEKRVRKVTVRKAALKPNNLQEMRPEVLQASDIEKSENANLTTLCTQILGRLTKVQRDTMAAVEAETREDMTDAEAEALMDRYGISPTGAIALFKFVVNPHSFGQTVENLFYVSFLIRDGKVGISTDGRGLPFLGATEPRHRNEIAKQGISKHQAVLALDMKTWETLIKVFDIKESMIRHREEDDHAAVGARGWYA